jgi:threonyl-tRNA synthetase
MQKKIAQCEVLHYNYIIVIGKKEVENKNINLRNPKITLNYDDFLELIK